MCVCVCVCMSMVSETRVCGAVVVLVGSMARFGVKVTSPFFLFFWLNGFWPRRLAFFFFFFLEHTYEFKKADLSLFKEQRTRQAASNEKGRKKMYREKRRFAVERSRELPDTSFPHFSPFESKNKERGMTNKKKKQGQRDEFFNCLNLMLLLLSLLCCVFCYCQCRLCLGFLFFICSLVTRRKGAFLPSSSLLMLFSRSSTFFFFL